MRDLKPFENYLIHEFVDDWRDGYLTRREMIKRVLYITGGVAATATVLTQLGVTPMTRAAMAQETVATPSAEPLSPLSVAEGDPRVLGEDITFPAADGAEIMAYQARPNPDSGSPMAMVIPPLGPDLPRKSWIDRAHPRRRPAVCGRRLCGMRARSPEPQRGNGRGDRSRGDPRLVERHRSASLRRRLQSRRSPITRRNRSWMPPDLR